MEFTQHAALLVFILHAIRATAAHYDTFEMKKTFFDGDAVNTFLEAILEPSKDLRFVECPDGIVCNENSVCCLLSSGEYGCCPHQQGQCCQGRDTCCDGAKGLACCSAPLKGCCPPTSQCCNDGGCCPKSAACCGKYCCSSGATCCGNSCCRGDCCPDKSCCPLAGSTCCGEGCCSSDYPVCCSDGKCCPSGTRCCNGGCCHVLDVSGATASAAVKASPKKRSP